VERGGGGVIEEEWMKKISKKIISLVLFKFKSKYKKNNQKVQGFFLNARYFVHLLCL